jgi:hypothetical protein
LSADFPVRADWLRVRATKRRRIARVLHLSAELSHTTMRGIETRVVMKGRTYNVGRNAAKRAAKLKRFA